jgi:hypothetical protein
MKKYTFIVAVTLLFGAYNTSAQNTEKNQAEKGEALEKKEVKVKNKVTLKAAHPTKSVSAKKTNIQKARIEEKNVAPAKKEENL